MPPKHIYPSQREFLEKFNHREHRIFIAPYDNPEDMRELGEIVKDAITIEKEVPIYTNGSISFTFKARINSKKKLRDAILRLIGAYRRRKQPKLTYKTIRLDCAKRNRHK